MSDQQGWKPPSTSDVSRMLTDSHLAIYEANDRETFTRELVRFSDRLGFKTITATLVIDKPSGRPDFITVDNTPPAYLELYHDRERGERNPVSQHCKTHNIPLAWDRSTYRHAGLDQDWELQANFGYECGMAVALHAPNGRHLMIGMDRDEPLPACSSTLLGWMACLQLFAAHAQEVAMQVLAPACQSELDQLIPTPRELECLRWTMEGKTAWELSRILGISEQTAVRHLYNATRKLGAANKHHAVIKALRAGLIG